MPGQNVNPNNPNDVSLTITVPTPIAQRILTAFTTIYGDQPQYAGLSGQALVKAVLVQFIRDQAVYAEANTAGNNARRNQEAQSRTDFAGIG